MQRPEKHVHLMVFMTYGNSLQTWADTGLIGRELLLYKKMVNAGNRVTLITYGDEEDLLYSQELDGISVVPIYSQLKKSDNKWVNLLRSFCIPFRLKHILKSADIFKTNQMGGAWVAVVAALLLQRPLIVRCGFEMLRNILRDECKWPVRLLRIVSAYMLELIAYTTASTIIISNRSAQRFIQDFYPIKKSKIKLIRNFIDTDLFAPDNFQCTSNSQSKTEASTSFFYERNISNKFFPVGNSGLNPVEQDRSILFVGRLENIKNLKNLIIASVEAKVRLEIIGKGGEQEIFKKLAEKQEGDIRFMGTVDNRQLPEIINKHAVFVLPSIYENNPKTLLEAMSCGRVVIGTDVEGIQELIIDGYNGFLCNTDAESIADTIKGVFQLDSNSLNRIARNARNLVIRECSISKVYQQETDIYKWLIQK